MLAIQNQISVLSKILETKIQHQKIIEYQQAVSASLHKLASPRSRKTSSNQDTSSQSGPILKDKKGVNITTGTTHEKLSENHNTTTVGVPQEQTNEIREEEEATIIPESTACVIS